MRNAKSSAGKVNVRILFLLIIWLIPAISFAQKQSDRISFIQFTDPHICNLDGYNLKFAKKRQHYGNGVKPMVDFLGTVPEKYKSDFVVITGDMIDFFESLTTSDELKGTQIEQFMGYLNTSEIPCYMTLGNHDIGTYPVYKPLYNQFNAEKARACWIRNADCFRDGTYYSQTMQVRNITYRLIFLDNAYYLPDRKKNGTPYIIDQMQLLWLDNELKKSEDDIEIIFMHMPLTGGVKLGNMESETADQNTADKNCGLYKVLEQNASASLIIAGHRHQNTIQEFTMSDDYTLTQVMTGSFGRDPENWRHIQLLSDRILISYPGKEKTELKISLN